LHCRIRESFGGFESSALLKQAVRRHAAGLARESILRVAGCGKLYIQLSAIVNLQDRDELDLKRAEVRR